MPLEAIQCSSCNNWRKDIHLLIKEYRRLATTQLVGLAMGLPATVAFQCIALRNAHRSIENLLQSPPLWLAVLMGIVTAGAFVYIQVPAARLGNRIQDMTDGLWKRLKD